MEFDSEVSVATGENEKELEKTYIVRVVCENKSMFVKFTENELNVRRFSEKGMNLFFFIGRYF